MECLKGQSTARLERAGGNRAAPPETGRMLLKWVRDDTTEPITAPSVIAAPRLARTMACDRTRTRVGPHSVQDLRVRSR
ncbi:hypothetical protein J6590_000653 [Homalodisca vitripennis]|nr:hypothetical protein J6590_000653 [Homalodisca vitripennis]